MTLQHTPNEYCCRYCERYLEPKKLAPMRKEILLKYEMIAINESKKLKLHNIMPLGVIQIIRNYCYPMHLVNVCNSIDCLFQRDYCCDNHLMCKHPCIGIYSEQHCLGCMQNDCINQAVRPGFTLIFCDIYYFLFVCKVYVHVFVTQFRKNSIRDFATNKKRKQQTHLKKQKKKQLMLRVYYVKWN